MKTTLLAFALLLIFSTHAQDTPRFTVTLKGWHGDNRPLPTSFDTIYLVARPKQTVKTFQQIRTTDSIFQLPAVAVGKYWLRFATAQYCVAPLPIVVCSKCDNTFDFFSFPKKAQDNCDVFSMVEISAGYAGGNKAMANDFQQGLSKKEWKQVKASRPFTVHFFLTKQKAISDLSFSPSNLPEEVKQTITKGLNNLTQWTPAIQNGSIVDAEYSIDKQALLGH